MRAVEAVEPALTLLVDHLRDAAAAKDDCDLIADFAAANPLEVIGNLLAMPDGDRTPLRGWSVAILAALQPALTSARCERGKVELTAYLRELVADRLKNSGNFRRTY